MGGRGDISAGKAFVELYAKDNRLVRGLSNASKRLKQWGKSVTIMGSAIAAAGTAAALPFVSSIRVFGEFSAEMSKVRAITGATDADFDALNNKAKELGSTTSFSAREVAQGMQFLGMAGFDTQQILAGIPSVLNLAKAGAVDLAVAADIASDVSSAFGLAADEIGRVADVIAATASGANTNVEMMGETMRYLAPLAAAAGQSLEDAATAAGVVANSGIKASMAGTDLAKIMKQLAGVKGGVLQGVKLTDAEGNMRSVIDIMEELGAATAEMSQTEQIQFMEQQFGRAAKSALILSKAGGSMRDLQADIKGSAGRAKEMADIMADNVPGAFKGLMSAVEGAQIAIGEALAPHIITATTALTKMVRAAVGFVSRNKSMVVAVAATVAGVVALGVALVGIGSAIWAAGVAVGAVATIISGAIGLIAGAVTFVISPVGLVVAAIAGAVAAWLAWTDSGKAAVKATQEAFAGILDTARKTVGGVFDAIAAGDLELAGQIAMAGLHLVVLRALVALSQMVGDVWGDTVAFIGGALMSGDVQGAWRAAIKGLSAAWGEFAAWVVKVMAGIAKGVVKVWSGSVKSLAKGMLKLAAKDTAAGRLMSKILGVDVRAEMERGRKLNAQLGIDDDPMDQMAADVDRQVDRMAKASNDVLDGIALEFSEAAEGAAEDLRERVGGATDGMAEELKAAEERLGKLTAEAKRKGDARRAKLAEAAARGKEAAGAKPGGPGGIGSDGGVGGTFSAAALGYMAGGDAIQKKMAGDVAEARKDGAARLKVEMAILTRLRQMEGPTFA